MDIERHCKSDWGLGYFVGLLANEQSLKFIYSEKATNVWDISTVDLSYVVTIKSSVEVLQNFVAFSEIMNFTKLSSELVHKYVLLQYLEVFSNISIVRL